MSDYMTLDQLNCGQNNFKFGDKRDNITTEERVQAYKECTNEGKFEVTRKGTVIIDSKCMLDKLNK